MRQWSYDTEIACSRQLFESTWCFSLVPTSQKGKVTDWMKIDSKKYKANNDIT
jgi:hypothetical protein